MSTKTVSIIRVHVYRAGTEWCYAAYDAAGFDHSDTLGIDTDADAMAEAGAQFPDAQIVRVPDVTSDGQPL